MKSDKFEVKILTWPESIGSWNLVNEYMQLRKKVFVEKKAWPLTTNGGLEFEQYDQFGTTYAVAVCDGKVVGGGRLLRTDLAPEMMGKLKYSYMISDAYMGVLPDIPAEICFDKPPKDPEIWEVTRLFSTGGYDVTSRMLDHIDRYLVYQGAKKCIMLGPPAFMRMAKKRGYNPRPMGKTVKNREGSFLAIMCDLKNVQQIPDVYDEREASPLKVLNG